MTRALQAMARVVRREVIAWAFAGVGLHWAWVHGLDRWTVLLALGVVWIHPGRTDDKQ